MAVVTKTLKSSGGDYSLMSVWESTEQTNLVAAGDTHVLECDAFTCTETSFVYLTGWTTNLNNGITIRAAAGAEHGGVWGEGFVLKVSSSVDMTLNIQQQYVSVEDITLWNASTVAEKLGTRLNAGYQTLKRLFVRCDSTGGTAPSAILALDVVGVTVENSVLLCANGAGLCAGSLATGLALNNCTIDADVGMQVYNTSAPTPSYVLQNNVFYANSFKFAGNTPTGTITNNAFESSLTGFGSNQVSITSAAFKDYAGGNYRPADENSPLWGAGTDLSLGTDIRGETITDISIGAYDNDIVLRTLKSTGGDYSLMSVWEADEQTDLVATGNRHVLECDAFAISDRLVLAGWTTDSSNFVTIRPAGGAEHNGVPGTGFGITYTSNFSNAISVTLNYTVITGIQVTGSGSGSQGISVGNTTVGCLIDGCIGTGGTGGTNDAGMAFRLQTASNPPSTVQNCLTVGGFQGIGNTVSGGSNIFYNNTIMNPTGIGVRLTTSVTATVELINNVVFGAGGATDYSMGTFSSLTASNNASEDLSAPGTSPVTGVASTDFVDYAGGNYQPTSTGKLAGAGTDLSAYFLDDITGEPR